MVHQFLWGGGSYGPYGIEVNPLGTRVYVVNRLASSFSVIDTSSNAVINTVTGVGNGSSGFGTFIQSILPTVTTATITGVTSSGASGGGTVTDDGGAPITARGGVLDYNV